MAKTILTSGVESTDSSSRIVYKVIDAKTAVNTVSDEIEICPKCHVIGIVAIGSVAVAGGVITLEASPISGYSGTWESLASITVSAGNTVYGASTDMEDNASGLAAQRYVRARISTVIANGTVDVYLGIVTN